MKTLIDAKVRHNGRPPFVWTARISHTEDDDGAHILTSDDIPGLVVADLSLDRAIAALPFVIEELIRRNMNRDCSVESLGFSDPRPKPNRAPELANIQFVNQKEAA